MLEMFLKIFLIVLVLCLIGCAIALLKNECTAYMRMKIFNAIVSYQLNRDFFGLIVSLNDMEDYDSTFYRWWDWGYTRILPPEKFEIIKPWIK